MGQNVNTETLSMSAPNIILDFFALYCFNSMDCITHFKILNIILQETHEL
jgi:hypothetical protein